MNDESQAAVAKTVASAVDPAPDFWLDPKALARRRAANSRRLHTQQIPMMRAAGFAVLCLMTVLHAVRGGPPFPSDMLIGLVALNLAYGGIAWWLLREAWGRTGRFDLSLALFHVDLLVWLPTLHFFEQTSLLFGLLLVVRVADQVGFGARRAFYFTHVVVGVYLAYAGFQWLQGDPQAFGADRIIVAATLYLVGVYIAITGIVTEGLLKRQRRAVRAGRDLVKFLGRQTRKLEAQAIELDLARRQAEDANVAKSQFLATISHEIRTPMSGILGTTELMLSGDMPGEQRRLARIAHESAGALLGIIDDILDLTRVEAGKLPLELAAFDPRRLAGDVVELMTPSARAKGLELRLEAEPDVPAGLLGDALRLRQVLVNLLGNAIKFTEIGEVVVSIASRPAVDPGAAVLRLEVRDTGIGIDEAHIARIFDPFTQADASTSRRYGGSGLGLAIVRELVQRMGGQVGVDSVHGVGSTFWFSIELERAPAEPAPPAEAPASDGLPSLNGRVLLAEDNPVNQLVLQALLERLGCQVVVVADGAAAVEAALGGGHDLVLMDCHMPGMDGYEATRQIRQHERGGTHRLPILALTAAALAEDREKCLAAGMDDHLSKPASLPQLGEALSRWLPRARADAATPSDEKVTAAGPAA